MLDSKRLTRKTYNSLARTYERTYQGEGDRRLIDLLLKRLAAGAKVLDAGCGPGGTANYISGRGFKVTGIDLSSQMIALAKKNAPQAEFWVMDIEDLSFPPGSFAGALAAWSLIHIPSSKVGQVLKNFARVLQPSGYLLVLVQKGQSDRIERNPIDKNRLAFVNFFTPKGLKKELAESGFIPVLWEEDPQIIDHDWPGTEGYIYALCQNQAD